MDGEMNISLTPELEKYVYDKIKNGLYTSASEVVREALRLMHTHETLQKQRIEQLSREIDIGLMELKSGQKIPAKESYDRLRKKIINTAKGGK